MASVLLAGAFGQGNPGDEALLDAFLGALPGWDAVATTADPDATAAVHDCDVVSTDGFRVARRARRADAVVVAGGTLFKTLHPSTGRPPNDLLRKSLLLALGAQTFGAPVAMVGVGAAPLTTSSAETMARALVRRADLLVLRDEESAAALARAGAALPLRVGADAAWTLLDEPPSVRSEGEDIVVAVSHLAGDRNLAPRLALALQPLLDAGLPVRLQPWQAAEDRPVAVAVAGALGGRGVVVDDAPETLVAARETFTTARLVIGLRFHSLVAAASAGVPFVAVAHEPKLAGLARRLGQPTVHPRRLERELSPAVLAALDGPAPSPAAVREQIALAEEGFRLLRLLVDGGRSLEPDALAGLPLSTGRTA